MVTIPSNYNTDIAKEKDQKLFNPLRSIAHLTRGDPLKHIIDNRQSFDDVVRADNRAVSDIFVEQFYTRVQD